MMMMTKKMMTKKSNSRDSCDKRKLVYFNRPQLVTQLIGANTTVIVAGRRTGKTDSIAAPFVLKMMQRMKGSTGGIVVPTYKHGLTNTIPGLLSAWRRWGFIKDVHYVIGKQPPKVFEKPITEPVSYEHVITFYNGSVAVLISQDRPGSSNSLTLSWLLIDEAKFIDYRKLKEETLPANGGIKTFFGKHSYNHAMMILSDMPQTQKGSWFLNYKDKMDVRVIKAIEATVYEIWRIKQHIRNLKTEGKKIPEYLKPKLRKLDRQLNQLRSVAVYYKEYSTIENVALLGVKYIRQMKRDLTPLTFRTSILCKRIGNTKDGFYSNFSERHKYNASNFDYLDSLGFEANSDAYDCRADADLNPYAPIAIGMDYNANINWLVAGQPTGRKLRVLKSFYVKFERKLPELIDDFCVYYQYHKEKTVVFYYDSTAIGSNYAVNEKDFCYVITDRFIKNGWQVQQVYLGNPMKHDEKYLLINQGFKGLNRLVPMFNRQNNDDLILALQVAGVTRGRNGFHKDKSKEKDPENEENLLEHRTDGTDAFDTLYIGCENFPYNHSDVYMTPGVV